MTDWKMALCQEAAGDVPVRGWKLTMLTPDVSLLKSCKIQGEHWKFVALLIMCCKFILRKASCQLDGWMSCTRFCLQESLWFRARIHSLKVLLAHNSVEYNWGFLSMNPPHCSLLIWISLNDWLTGWLVGWLVGCVDDWLIDWTLRHTIKIFDDFVRQYRTLVNSRDLSR